MARQDEEGVVMLLLFRVKFGVDPYFLHLGVNTCPRNSGCDHPRYSRGRRLDTPEPKPVFSVCSKPYIRVRHGLHPFANARDIDPKGSLPPVGVVTECPYDDIVVAVTIHVLRGAAKARANAE